MVDTARGRCPVATKRSAQPPAFADSRRFFCTQMFLPSLGSGRRPGWEICGSYLRPIQFCNAGGVTRDRQIVIRQTTSCTADYSAKGSSASSCISTRTSTSCRSSDMNALARISSASARDNHSARTTSVPSLNSQITRRGSSSSGSLAGAAKYGFGAMQTSQSNGRAYRAAHLPATVSWYQSCDMFDLCQGPASLSSPQAMSGCQPGRG